MVKTTYEPVLADSKFKTSTWSGSPRWTSTVCHGFFTPCRFFEVLPSDRWACDIRSYTRMSTPIAPVYGDIFCHYVAMFIPKRILYDGCAQFYGEAPSFGVATTINEPTTYHDDSVVLRSTLNDAQAWSTFGSAFGLIQDGVSRTAKANRIGVNMLPIWAYFAVYNEYVRNENYQPKYMWNKTLTGAGDRVFGTLGLNSITAASPLAQVNKDKDVFTSLLPYAMKSTDPVTVNVDGSSTIVNDGPLSFSSIKNDGSMETGIYGLRPAKLFDVNDDPLTVYADQADRSFSTNYIAGHLTPPYVPILDNQGGSTSAVPNVVEGSSSNYYTNALGYKGGLKVNNSLSTNLSTLIYSLSYQHYLSRLAKFGSKYGEYLEAIFGAKCPAATRDEPEFLGHFSYRLNVDTVVQTSGHVAGQASELGQLGGNSQTRRDGKFFNFSATEPGYLMVFCYFKHKRLYSNGMDPSFLKKELLDYYQTPFANIPDVSFDSERLWFDDNKNTRKSLGFSEPWVENKFFTDVCFGGVNPANPNSIDYLTLADKLTSEPTITADWLKEDRNSISRALTTGSSGFDYICDAFFDITVSRTMPLLSTGLGVL